MDTKTDKEQLESYLEIQNRKVRNNVEIVEAKDLELPFMLHIDKKPPAKFIPMMPRRAADSEDNTMPRVTVADTLMGCIIAYGSFWSDFYYDDVQGYIISAIDFESALKPTDKLVYDASSTNEHWLVGYNTKNLSFKPRSVGKLFATDIKVARFYKDGKLQVGDQSLIFYIELEETILLAKKRKVEPGYYRVSLSHENISRHICFDSDKELVIEKITAREYQAKKKVSAVLLHADNTVETKKKPVYAGW